MVFNKTDLFAYELKDADDLTPRTRKNNSLEDWKKTWISKNNNNCVFISASKKDNWDNFKATYTIALKKYTQKDIHITLFYIKNVAPLKKTK